MPIKIGKILTTLLVDSGSACSILNRPLASQVSGSSLNAFWFHDNTFLQLRNFLNEPVHIESKVQAAVLSNGCTYHSTTFTVVADGLQSLIGRELFDQLGLAVTQSSSLPDEDIVTPEATLPGDKWLNSYNSDIELETGMTRATRDASEMERESTDVNSRFFRSAVCRPIPLTEKAVKLKSAQKTTVKEDLKRIPRACLKC